ncbi:MAG: DUF4253 domain-containing protein [Gammaproteobacteria bacterium]
MLESIEDLKSLVAASPLEKLKFRQINIPDTGASVFAAKLGKTDLHAAWDAARALVDKTGRWPLLYDMRFSGLSGSLEDRLLEIALSRYPFEDETGSALLPAAIIEASEHVDVDRYLEQRARESDEDDDTDWVLEEIEAELGRRPEPAELDASIVYKVHRADRWAFDRQLEQGNVEDRTVESQTEFPPGKPVLLLMPTASGAETLAWSSWCGAEGCEAETIAVLRDWTRKFGAELYANYGTMLEFNVANPPGDPIEAWNLATQHDLVAPSSLAAPGIAVRHYAASLIGYDRWHLHEQP